MTMQTISLKIEDKVLKEIDQKLAKYRYSTRTELIRDAIRKRLSDLEKEEIHKAIDRLYGSSKRKTTDEQLHAAGERAFEDLRKKFKIK